MVNIGDKMRRYNGGVTVIYTEEEIEKKGLGLLNIDWTAEFENIQFSDKFILKWKGIFSKHDWMVISRYQYMHMRTIHKLADYLDWHEIALRQRLTEHFIERHLDKLNWEDLSLGQHLKESFIEKHADEVDWGEISFKNYLTIPFVRKWKDRIIWSNFSQVYRTYYDAEFCREFADYLDWEEIHEWIWDRFLKKDIDYVREFREYVNWSEIEENFYFKKEYVREFWNEISWLYEEDYKHDPKLIKEFDDKLIEET